VKYIGMRHTPCQMSCWRRIKNWISIHVRGTEFSLSKPALQPTQRPVRWVWGGCVFGDKEVSAW